MEYIYEIIWLSLWALVIYLGFKFSKKNILKFDEKLETK